MEMLEMIYSIAEIILSLHISLSNLLVLFVYLQTRRIRTITNTYIFSLALTDFLAGTIGIPSTVYTVITLAPHSFLSCLMVHSLLFVLRTISTFHLLAIAIDKYMSICCRNQLLQQTTRSQRALILLSMAWILGAFIAILPLFSMQNLAEMSEKFHGECHFIDHRIKYFLCGRERERRIRNRRKLIRILLILVLIYIICLYPLYLLHILSLFFNEFHTNTTIRFFAIILSHFSCALNPLIFAYGMPCFKQALRQCLKLSTNDQTLKYSTYMCSNRTRIV
uniref:G-protein coupled receptors family 1 profile domain-containing protein n=1 Tax=Parascaris equorum TaxID=6256 RepID=A0A914RUI8_PAREQ